MLQIAFQFVAACALVGFAIRMHLSLQRRERRKWQEILGDFVDSEGRLAALSYQITVSEDIACPEEELWSRIGGIRGLWIMFVNVEALLEAINFAAKSSQTLAPMDQSLRRIRAESLRARRLILLALFRSWMIVVKSPRPPSVTLAVSAYLGSIARFGLALNDFRPDLLKSFRYQMART
jgi:hypothetical protein